MVRLRSFLFATCAAAGVLFWFWVGFPFDHHNESYVISSQLHTMDFWSATFGRVFPVANLRPAGQGLMWLAVAMPWGLGLIQIFNMACTVLAFVLALRGAREQGPLSLALCASGAILFSGYIFLFHLHGVFYGPMLVLAAVLLGLSPKAIQTGTFVWVGALTLVTLLFHPYAVLLFGAWVVAVVLEGPVDRRVLLRRGLPVSAVVAGVAGFLLFLPPRESAQPLMDMLLGGIVSYAVVEVHPLVTAFSAVLVVLTVATFPRQFRSWGVVLGLAGILSTVFLALPMVLVWVLACLLKAAVMRRWVPFFLLGMTSVFPFPTATGSPTYSIFAILIATVVMVEGIGTVGSVLDRWYPRVAGAIVVGALLGLIMIKLEVRVPGLSSLARPLLAEKEKTHQLQAVLRWNDSAEGPKGRVVLSRLSLNPTSAPDAVDRTHRPPTSQVFLDRFMRSYYPARDTLAPTCTVTFGNDSLPGSLPVVSLSGPNAGATLIYLQ